MSRKIGLDTKVLRCCGILTLYDNEGDTYESFRKQLCLFTSTYTNISHYYFICHDDAERLHIHFIFSFVSQVRLQTILNKLSTFLNVDVNRIGLEKLTNLNAHLRYFLHLEEDESKKRYLPIDIVSDESLDTINNYIGTDDDSLTIKRLFSLVMKYDDEIDLMYYLDLPLYHRYRHEIKTLYERRFHLLGHYAFLKENESDNENNLPF